YKRTGFTLMELIITCVLISILLGVIWLVYFAGFKSFDSQMSRSNIKGEAGRLLESMGNELRQTVSISSAQQTNLSFSVDTNGDGLNETIQYNWSGVAGDPLNQTWSSLVIPVISSINSLAFSYYDSNNSLLSFPVTASQVRLVAIDFTVSKADETFHLTGKFRIRSL
ncbi:prepilin-type N-terminal cleavage/methylation domain-containing protein, partial [bacterium]